MTFWDGYRWRPEAPKQLPPRTHPVRDAAATIVMILGLFAIAFPLNPAAAFGPSLSLAPATASVGSSVGVGGVTFPAKATVQFLLDGRAAGMPRVKVSPLGTIKTSFVVPQVANGGHQLGAEIASSRGGRNPTPNAGTVVATVTLTVTDPSLITPPGPSVPASPAATSAPSVAPTSAATPSATPVATSTAAATASAQPTVGATPAPPPTVSGIVQKQGATFVLNGSPFVFTGFSIYNANSRFVSTCWDTLNEGTSLSDSLSLLGGQEVFRAWFYQGLALTNGVRDWSAFDKTLAVAAAHNMRVLLSLSGEGGDCKDFPVDSHKYEAWYLNGYNQPETSGVSYLQWIQEVGARYRNNPAVFGYQLMGEAEDPIDASGTCSSTSVATLKAWADASAAAIKAVDPTHLVTVGVIGTGQCGASGTAYQGLHSGPNIDFCTVEDYGSPAVALPGDQWNGMLTRIAECNAMGKPLVVSESGIGRTDPNRAAEWDIKMAAQFGAGVRGFLIWDWSPRWVSDGYEVMPGDPTLGLLQKY